MNPKVRYVKGPDEVHLAYWEAGDGVPLLYMPATPLTHVQLEWEIDDQRRWYERLIASGIRLIRYDARGMGLSDREVDDFSMGSQLRDLDAVVDALNLDRFAIIGTTDFGMLAMNWAALHPERVSHLILWCTWASRSRVAGQTQTRTLRALVDQDWVIYTETVARVLLGWSSEELARKFAEFYRACTTPEVLKKHVPAVYEWDVSDKLSSIECPTLVIQRREIPTLPTDLSRELARGIPDARLVLLDGRSPLPFAEDTDALLSVIADFLGTGGEVPSAVTTGQTPVTILFTDMEGSTATTQRLGDTSAQEVLRTHNRIVRNALAVHGGTEIKHTGDGLMVSFQSATRAVECAVAIQRAVDTYCRTSPGVPLRVRIGLNAGEPLAERGDYFGAAVQMAARVCERCPPGEVLVSRVVRDLTAGKGFKFHDRGEETLRGFDEPVRLFAVDWQDTLDKRE